ncbi:hypothetical protein Tco_0757060 [Tanacetum coccineum]
MKDLNVIRNNANGLVAKGYAQEEVLNSTNHLLSCSLWRLSGSLFRYAAHKSFPIYRGRMKTAILNGHIEAGGDIKQGRLKKTPQELFQMPIMPVALILAKAFGGISVPRWPELWVSAKFRAASLLWMRTQLQVLWLQYNIITVLYCDSSVSNSNLMQPRAGTHSYQALSILVNKESYAFHLCDFCQNIRVDTYVLTMKMEICIEPASKQALGTLTCEILMNNCVFGIDNDGAIQCESNLFQEMN